MFNPKSLKHRGKNLKTKIDFSDFSHSYSSDKLKLMVDFFIKRGFEINEEIKILLKNIQEKNIFVEKIRLKMNEENENYDALQEQYDEELNRLFNLLLKLRSAYNNTTRSVHGAIFDLASEFRQVYSSLDYDEFQQKSEELIEQNYALTFKIVNDNCIEFSFEGLISERNYERDDLLVIAIFNGLRRTISQNEGVFSSFSQLYVCFEQYMSNVNLQYIRDTDRINFSGILNAIVEGVAWTDRSDCLNIFTQSYKKNNEETPNYTKILVMTPEEFFDYIFKMGNDYLKMKNRITIQNE